MFKLGLIYIFSALIVHDIITSSVKDYGEFNLAVTKVTTCKGPKQKDCCVVSARIYNASQLLYDIEILKDMIPDKGKIMALANGKPLVRFQMKNPCDHLFIGQILRGIFKATSRCLFKKGNFSFNVNLEDMAQKYYGGMFLYGNLTFKSQFYNDECNFSCTVVEVDIYPKNKTTV